MLDLLQEESESQLNERPNKRRRANSPQKGPLSTEAQSEASCPYSLRPRKENPLKRKMVDLLQEESESQLNERPNKRRRTNSPQKEGPLSTETQSETSCSYSLRSRKGNPLKRKLTDLEEPETPLMEMRMKRRRNETEETKETKGVLSAEIQSEESCKEETTDLPQEQMPKEQRKPETKKNNIHSMNELLSTCSEPSDSFSTEDHDVSDPQPEDLPDDFTERYTLRELLGSESNAKVYAGIRKSDGEQVAIKYLLKCFVDHFTLPDDTRSLPHEGMMMEFVSRSRSSPYVIKLLEWFETPKGFLLVMEQPQNFINLQQFRRGLEGRMSEDVAQIIMRKIIQALIHCRECGVLHLDVKEHNILVNPETLDLKLTDFSQARLIYSRTYRAFGGPPVFLPINWLATHFLGDVASTVRDLGLLLCTLTWGENTLDVPIPLSFDGLSKELLSTCSEPSDSFSTEDHDVSDPQPEDLPDDFTERYTLGELLGSESNAKVYTGIRKSDGEQVAIKYLLKCFVDHFTLPDDTRSLPHEGMMMEFVSRSRSSPYVIKLHEWFETPKGFLLVMERPQNFINLQQFRRGLEGRMSEDVARIIMLKIIQALIHCRECGVLHLDVKEHNILVNPETLDLKLTDFSQARLIYSRTYRAFGELLSTCSEPSDSFSTEDHDVSDPQPEDLPDDFTERYTLGELLGSESNTKVYTGIRKSDGEQVAIKYLLKCFVDYFTLPDDTRSLPHEGMMMEFVSRSRSSPYVIKLHEWFETPKGFLLVMERPQNFITPQKFRRGLEGRMSEDVARIIMRKIKGPLSTEAQSEASWPYSLRPRKENPLKRKMLDLLQEESESQLNERPNKRRRANSPQKGPLSTEAQSEASCPYSLRPRKENPLKRKMVDLLQEESESQLKERPKKRRRTNSPQKEGTLSTETQSETSCSYSLRSRKGNPLKRKLTDLEEPETPLMEMRMKRRRNETEETKETKGVLSAEIQSEESCKEETTDLPQEQMPKEQRKPETKKNNIHSMNELLSTFSEPSDSFSTEDHDVSDPQPEDLPDDFTERYTLGELLGSESNAKVYTGIRKSDGEQVAIKYLLKCFVDHFTLPDDTRSLPHEGMMMEFVSRSRSSPYVIKLHEWFETPKGFLLVMEQPQNFINLQQFRRGLEGRMSEDVAQIIMRKIIQALIHCRECGVLHLDVKEHNILVNPETLDLKLTDFSQARLIYSRTYRAFGELLSTCSEPSDSFSTEDHDVSDPQPEDLPDDFTERYTLGELLGSESNAKVYAGIRKSDGEQVAIKYLLKCFVDYFTLPDDTRSLPHEGMMMEFVSRSRSSPYVIKLHEWFETPKGFLLVMERPQNFITPQKFRRGLEGRMSEDVARIIMRKIKGPLSTEAQSEASWPYSLRPRKENPLKRKMLDLLQEESESQLNERPNKRRRANSPQKGPLSTEAQSEASCPYSLRPRKENPLKRKMVDLLQEESESQLKERPKKRRRTNSPQKEGPLSTETQSETSCSYSLRSRKGNPLKRKLTDLEEPETPLMEMRMKRRRNETEETKETKGVLSAEIQSEESCKEETTDLPQEQMPKEQRKPETKKNNIHSMNELLSTFSEPSDSFSTEDHDVSDPQPEDLPDDFTERYTLGELLGSESNAKVYTGIRKSDGEQVAIKYLLKCFVDHFTLPDDTRSLPHEGMMMEFVSRSRSSPYVIKLHEWFETPKGFLLVMERPQNFINLQQFRRGLEGRMSEDVAQIIMRKIIQALIHCRECGVLHLDVKEHNILVNPETLDLKLTDFSQARLIYSRTYRAFGELLSTYSEPSDSFSTEDHDVSDPQPEDLPDDFTERYTLGELLGSESNAKVYAGIRKSDGEQVAIKYLLKCFVDYFTLPDDTRSLPHEGMMMEFVSRSRSSPYVIKLHEWFETPKGFLLVMERPQNFITPQKFRRGLEGRMSEDVARIIMRKISQASKKKKKKKKEERLKSSQKSQGQLESVKYLHVLVSKHSTGVMM
ncbi:hypothetical protein KOW79_016781 [Hemibagrus wyckioides]|uniref:Serine/threonine-protein kinase 1 n=1 Tax=Hemibagrus wyckioides TaxID=337641 RepID=A0A9D3SHH0_9TELE|nr:hypothetical protein KOW79_016781 [Hemibagrus wyckioides]